MSTTTTKKRPPAKKAQRRGKKTTYDQTLARADRELDRAFKKVMKGVQGNHYQQIKELEHLQALLEKETDCKAFILSPDLPIPQAIVDRVLGEQVRVPSASEALFAFYGWLTTRDRPIILSAHHNAAVVAELVNIFITKQGLSIPCPKWEDQFISMAGVATDLTNDPALNPNQVASPPPTFDEAFQQVLGLFRFFHDQRQNHLLARLIEELSETRLAEFHALSDKLERTTDRHHQLADAAKELDQVLSGNFTIVHT